MGDVAVMQYPVSGLPWASGRRENRWFGIILGLMIGVFSLPAVLIPLMHLPDTERTEAEKIQPQLARLLERPEQIEPAASQLAKKEPVTRSEPARAEPVPIPAAVPPETTVPVAQVEQSVEAAREKAARSGLLAMKDRLAALRAPAVSEPRRFNANVGDDTAGRQNDPVADRPESSDILRGSGGIERVAEPVAEVSVATHTVKTVDAPSVGESLVANAGESRRKRAADKGSEERAMSNIRRVFDAQKTALYSLYRRELRQDPTLEGKVTLELVIEPDGSVSDCRVIGSELANPSLEQRIAMRVRLFDFGAENVGTRRVRFPIDFLPG